MVACWRKRIVLARDHGLRRDEEQEHEVPVLRSIGMSCLILIWATRRSPSLLRTPRQEWLDARRAADAMWALTPARAGEHATQHADLAGHDGACGRR